MSMRVDTGTLCTQVNAMRTTVQNTPDKHWRGKIRKLQIKKKLIKNLTED